MSHILIVDDEASVRNALRRTLRKEPYKLSFAESATQALEMMRTERPDLLVTDHLMPQMTGLDLLRRVRLLYPHMGRIILTGQAEMDTVVAAINEGEIFRFLRKPWNDDELLVTLNAAIQQLAEDANNRALLAEARKQEQMRQEAAKANAGIHHVNRDESGAIVISEEELAALG